jgi:hypothetical protein
VARRGIRSSALAGAGREVEVPAGRDIEHGSAFRYLRRARSLGGPIGFSGATGTDVRTRAGTSQRVVWILSAVGPSWARPVATMARPMAMMSATIPSICSVLLSSAGLN